MKDSKLKDHAARAEEFIRDEERVDWHDGALWYIRQKRDIASKQIPEWEQLLSAGALTQNMLLAAAALGVGAQWNTDWIAYDREIMTSMGLSEAEKIVGFVYFGTPQGALEDRPRPDPESLITRWQG